eukprot:6186918-Alexandrium_andersonii.AAC.1
MPQKAPLGSLGDPLSVVPGPAQSKVRTPLASGIMTRGSAEERWQTTSNELPESHFGRCSALSNWPGASRRRKKVPNQRCQWEMGW